MPSDIQLPQGGRGRVSDVIDRLRDEVLNGMMRPGARLRLEALSRLVAEGLVLIDGQRGFRVIPVRAAPPPNRHPPAKARAMIDFLMQRFGPMPPWGSVVGLEKLERSET